MPRIGGAVSARAVGGAGDSVPPERACAAEPAPISWADDDAPVPVVCLFATNQTAVGLNGRPGRYRLLRAALPP